MGENFMFYLIGGIICLSLTIYITRLIFGIPIIIKHMKAQTQLLGKIAEKIGVPEHEIDNINEAAKFDPLKP